MKAAWLLLAAASLGFAQKTVLDGVYTSAQAQRGDAVFAAKCARCHEGADVDGPPLTGDPFVDRWREDNLGGLFQFVKTRMPQDAPGSLDVKTYLDLIARLLNANRYPAGQAELTNPESVMLVGHDGPQPLPNNAMVVAVGCVTPAPGGLWTLTNVPNLSRTQTGDETTPEELKASAAKPLGTAVYRLNNPPSPESNKGHKAQVKGVYSKQGDALRINVLSFESLAPSCP